MLRAQQPIARELPCRLCRANPLDAEGIEKFIRNRLVSTAPSVWTKSDREPLSPRASSQSRLATMPSSQVPVREEEDPTQRMVIVRTPTAALEAKPMDNLSRDCRCEALGRPRRRSSPECTSRSCPGPRPRRDDPPRPESHLACRETPTRSTRVAATPPAWRWWHEAACASPQSPDFAERVTHTSSSGAWLCAELGRSLHPVSTSNSPWGTRGTWSCSNTRWQRKRTASGGEECPRTPRPRLAAPNGPRARGSLRSLVSLDAI